MKWRMIVYGVVAMVAAGAALEPVWGLFGDEYRDLLTETLGRDPRGFALAVVVAPLLEEFLFRALLCRGLARWWGSDAWAIVASALVFGAAHYPIWPQMPVAVVGGLVLGYTYRATNTIWVPVAIHFANNLLAWATW